MIGKSLPQPRGRVGVGVVAALAAIAILVVITITWMRGPKSLGANEGQAIAASFLSEIRAGRVDAAWEGTTTEFKSMLGLEGLRSLVKKHPVLRQEAGFVREGELLSNGITLREVVFRGDQAGSEVKVLLAPDSGSWKVERLIAEG